MTPEEIVALVDFRYITDALTPERGARSPRARSRPAAREREAELRRDGYPAYTTSVGWLGYDDDKIRRLCREALADGWTRFKMKVGADVDGRPPAGADRARGDRARTRMLAVDANQRWDVDEAIAWMAGLARVRPVLDRGAHQPGRHPRPRRDRPRRGADPGRDRRARPQPGHVQAAVPGRRRSRVCQIDACRLGGVNEVLAVLLHGRRVRRPGLSRTPAASGCASSSSTWPRSTTSRSAARSTAG